VTGEDVAQRALDITGRVHRPIFAPGSRSRPFAYDRPVMADNLERLTNLLALLLEAREPRTLDEIASELSGMYPDNHVSRRGQFERDKAVLRDIGVPIEMETLGGDRAGQAAYRIDRRRYELADLDLTDDERHALQVAVAAVRSQDSWAQEALWKLGGAATEAAPVAAVVPALDALPALSEATREHRAVAFDYRGVRRTLDPYGLLLRDGFWYVVGFDHGHGERRTYRVDRIEGAVGPVGAASSHPPAGFDVRTAFPSDPKVMGDLGSGTTTATVRVGPGRAAAVVRELGDDAVIARHADGAVDVAVGATNRPAFRSWLLGLDDHAEVLAPADVRADVVDWLLALAGGR
jgi:predicted DNA-binding transcriptional regulator YafY